MTLQLKRIYDPVDNDDGFRVLVDRLWPRGVSKADARIDLWVKELAPTANLRRWFDHEESKFDEFRSRYLDELATKRDQAHNVLEQAAGRTVTLLFAARDRCCNHAVVLQEFLSSD